MMAAAIPYRPGETPDSYCSRLAYRCGCETAATFCADFGITFSSVITGEEEGLGVLARLGGASTRTISAAAFIERDRVFYECGGEIVTRHSFERHRLKVCPGCLLDDLAAEPELGLAAAYRRAAWMLVSVRTCHIHGRELVDLIPQADYVELTRRIAGTPFPVP